MLEILRVFYFTAFRKATPATALPFQEKWSGAPAI
jgi:hypothetical protein